ncbi:hypothetical protein KTR66_19415 [Roseococcus sp. SDR]|uniref:hypothetical protein n=1 Tax=Roseococcus sp. SDR TaxID=2835532 RepID=UPI001BD18633|nr:hypothetical protein [Roseococcus sp. SDR]MBS7792177.1 hypothetical protein [Roseococcus sp. SDR]MBV1847491.1 hypothetical protein [Roseococcus sp. SDR]
MGAAGKPSVGTKAEYAEHRGCSRAYVSKLIRQGRLAEPALLPDGRINFILADQLIGAAIEDEQPAASAPQAGPSYAEQRARREAAEAELAEIKLGTLRGEYVRRSAVRIAAEQVFARALARLGERWGDVAIELAKMTDPAAIAERLAEEQRAAMGAINGEFLEDAARRSAG